MTGAYLILIAVSMVIMLIATIKKQDLIFAYATGVWSTLIFAFVVHINFPKAIDVYRGKTTLKITYVNNVATDSTVIYK